MIPARLSLIAAGVALVMAASGEAVACGGSPSTNPYVADGLRAEDEAGVAAGDIVFYAFLVSRFERMYDIDYEVRPTEPVPGLTDTPIISSPTRTATSCGPWPHFYLDWDREIRVGGGVIVRASFTPSGLVIRQIASNHSLEGNRLRDLSRPDQDDTLTDDADQ